MEKGEIMDTIVQFFIGTAPEGSEQLYFVFRAIMGLMLYDMLLDVFRFVRGILKV